MQNCFREHPDVYGSELEDDEASAPEAAPEDGTSPPTTSETSAVAQPQTPARGGPTENFVNTKPHQQAKDQDTHGKRERAQEATEQVKQDHDPLSESEELVPKAWHDSRDSTTNK